MFFKKNEERLAAFSKLSQTAGARADYVQGGGGNTSVKLADGLMAIKASGYCLKDITPEALAQVSTTIAMGRLGQPEEISKMFIF